MARKEIERVVDAVVEQEGLEDINWYNEFSSETKEFFEEMGWSREEIERYMQEYPVAGTILQQGDPNVDSVISLLEEMSSVYGGNTGPSESLEARLLVDWLRVRLLR